MFKEGGREDRTAWTLNYFDVSFKIRFPWMFKEGGREDRTSWIWNYFDVSCMYYFDVQRGRKGGQNIMDFELLSCFMHELLGCSKREGGRTEHHGL